MHYKYIPAVIFTLGTCMYFMVSSCSNQAAGSSQETPIDPNAPVAFDSVKKAAIDTMAMKINEIVNQNRYQAKKIPNPVYTPTDSIIYLLTDDHHARISMNMHPDSNIIWPYFWVYNGQVILMRLRTYSKSDNSRSASETVVYLDNGKIVYCQERKKTLDANEIPGAVQVEPFVKSSRTYSDLDSEFKKYWTEVTGEMKKNNVLPDWIKI
jgi:hypothetical protein